MKIVVFDTETTGLLPKKKDATIDEYPYIVQLSFITFDLTENILTSIEVYDYYVNPPIPITNAFIHHITNEIAQQKGTTIRNALSVFQSVLHHSDICVAHNAQFDITVLDMEAKRNDMYFDYPDIVCTMKETIDYCNLRVPSKHGGGFFKKYPKLLELSEKLFQEIPKNLHNAKTDILVCLRCFMKWTHQVDIRRTDRHFRRLYRENCL